MEGIVKSIGDMVNEQINAGSEHARAHFGSIGDDFSSIAEDLLRHDRVAFSLFVNAALIGLSGSSLRETVERLSPGGIPPAGRAMELAIKAIRQNSQVVAPLLEQIYIGIQVGRRLQREEDEALRGIEKASEEEGA